jgi:hypothetical protein
MSHPNDPDYSNPNEYWSERMDKAMEEDPSFFEPELLEASKKLLSGEPLDDLFEVMDIYDKGVEWYKLMQEESFYEPSEVYE